jgi:hypothetical protein
MLRFDVPPVWSNVARFEALITFALCAIAVVSSTPWLLAIPAVQGLVRGFLGHPRDPLHRAWKRLFEARGWAGRKENAGAKMFANKILFFVSVAAIVIAAFGSTAWRIPAIVLGTFATLEWAFSFCAACWAYAAWYRVFPPLDEGQTRGGGKP